MRRALTLALIVLVPALAGCTGSPPPREAPYSTLVDLAFEKRPDAEADDRLVAAGGVEGAADVARGNGLAPSWTFIYASASAGRLGCIVLSAGGATLERKAYPTPGNTTFGDALDGAIDSPAAVVAAKKDPAFGQAAVRSARFVETLTSDETGVYWVVATESPGGNVTAVDVDAHTGTIKTGAYAWSPTADRARCP